MNTGIKEGEFKIIPNNTVSIHNGADELYHIIPSGFEDKYIVVDGGPHFNGEVALMEAWELYDKYKLVVQKPINQTSEIVS